MKCPKSPILRMKYWGITGLIGGCWDNAFVYNLPVIILITLACKCTSTMDGGGKESWSERVQESEDEGKALEASRDTNRTPPLRERRNAAKNNPYAPAAPAAPAAKKNIDKLSQQGPTSRAPQPQGCPDTPTPAQRPATLEPSVPQKAKPTDTPNGKHDTRPSKVPVLTPSSSAMITPPREIQRRSGTVIEQTPECREEQENQETCL